jgi:glycosyltransferase involved in cell wall biosynthesis
MKVLQVHNTYLLSGGEDTVVEAERRLLIDHGHDVVVYKVNNDTIEGLSGKLKTAWRAPYSVDSLKKFVQVVKESAPDIVHVHNFFPLITPSIYDACQEFGIPVVQTLHNFRLICPGALLMRDGKACDLCLKGSAYQAVLYRCYRNSLMGSLAVARMVEFHRKRGTWHTKVDCFIALTDFARDQFVQAGFPADKIKVKPNFVAAPAVTARGRERSGALFVGRLSEEKGVRLLIEAWRHIDTPLRIAGDGPLLEWVSQFKSPQVTVLGKITADEVRTEMQQAAFLVFPSLCYEGFPLVIAEAFSLALPVIASRFGSMAEIVSDGHNGLHFTAGDADDFIRCITWAVENPDQLERLGGNSRRTYQEKYCADINYRQLLDIYQHVCRQKGR